MLSRRDLAKLISLAALIIAIAALWLGPYREYCQADHAENEYCAAYKISVTLGHFLRAYGEAITAVATLAIALFTWTLWRSTNKLWEAGERHSERELRAYLVVNAEDMCLPQNPNGPMFATLNIKNTGQTPAHDVRSISRTDFFDQPFPPDFDFSIPLTDDQFSVGLIGPGQNSGIESYSDPLTQNDWKTLRENSETRRPCTYGTVTYRDVFDRPQYTNFCIVHVVECDVMAGSITIVGQTARYHNDAS